MQIDTTQHILTGSLSEITDMLTTIRVSQGLRQTDLAKKTGIPQSNISRMEKGYLPTIPTIEKIVKGLGMEIRIQFYLEK